MDVLNPKLIWVEGRCYRVQDSACNDSTTPYIEDDCQMDYEEEEFNDNVIEVVPYGSRKFKHTFHVAKSFFPHIVGARNATRTKIEAETKTNIHIPKMNQDEDIEITGSYRKGIILARHRIDLLIESVRRRLKPTHFLSIPLNDDHIIKNYNSFKNDVLHNHGGEVSPIDEALFQIPIKLHLTIGMLVLQDDAERKKAVEALNYCKEHIVKPIVEKYERIVIHLQGIDIMNDDPSSANILYAKVVTENDGLQELTNKIADYYSEIGLITRQRDRVKLHVTLMNTRYQSNDEEVPNKAFNKFDATAILKAHKNTFFGETVAKEIHVSQLHTSSDVAYYSATAKINLLENN